jgi:hypothetical protein
MLADFFTKPLQGALFRKLAAVVMGHKHISSLTEATSPGTKEWVGESEITGKRQNGESSGNVTKAGVKATDSAINHKAQQPTKVSFANVVKGKSPTKIDSSERSVGTVPLTLRK